MSRHTQPGNIGSGRPGADARTIYLRRRRRLTRWVLALAWLGWAVCLAGLLLMLLDVRTSVVSGPVLAAIGVAQIGVGTKQTYRPVRSVGVANLTLFIVLTVLLFTFRWPPRMALPWLFGSSSAYTLVMLFVLVRLPRRFVAGRSPLACARCGYLLYGLAESRCPECGLPFDRSVLERAAPPTAR